MRTTRSTRIRKHRTDPQLDAYWSWNTFCLVLLIAVILPTSANAANDRLLYVMSDLTIPNLGNTRGPLTTADTVSGANPQSTGIEKVRAISLSPNGQLIAYEIEPGTVWLSNRDGSVHHVFMTNATLYSFDPTGTKLLVAGHAENPECHGLCWVNLDGSAITPFSVQPNAFWGPTVSPDGTQIVWAGLGQTSKTKKAANLFVAHADGSSPKQITFFYEKTTPPSVYGPPQFGPNDTIAFMGTLANDEIWTIKADGTGLALVPNVYANYFSWTPDGKLNIDVDNTLCGMYTVNPDGSDFTRVPVNDPSTCFQSPQGQNELPKGVYRLPSTQVGYSDYLAAQYEPVLRFDSSEKWRPLNVEDFLAEGQHQICENETCDEAPSTSPEDLNRHRGENAYVNVAGDYSPGGGEGDYHSPYEECTANGLRDCDSGPRSAIYWRPGGSYGGYEYIDYWFFYRANYFYEEADFHEGDWEGVTIAPSLIDGTFDYAAFSQHGTYYSYLRDVLRCEDSPSVGIPERGTCGTEAGHQGFRVDDFVANGDHANYTTPCSEEVILLSCQQNGSGEFDRGYDGAVRWGRAFDDPATFASSLLRMPPVGATSWTDWPGHWGSPAPELSLQNGGPASPGNQTISIDCASVDNEPGCTTGPRGSTSSTGVAAATSPGLTATSCSAWAGEGIAAVVCNPHELRHAVMTGHVGRNADLKISSIGASDKDTAASGQGIAQYAGAGLRNGSQLGIQGNLQKNTVVIVRANRGRHKDPLLGRFRLKMPSHLASTASTGPRQWKLKLEVEQHPTGHIRMSLGRFHANDIFVLRSAW